MKKIKLYADTYKTNALIYGYEEGSEDQVFSHHEYYSHDLCSGFTDDEWESALREELKMELAEKGLTVDELNFDEVILQVMIFASGCCEDSDE